VMSRGTLSGDDYAVKCDSKTGILKLCGFTIKGKTEGNRLRINRAPVKEILASRTHFCPKSRLFEPELGPADKTHTDISGPLQKSLDEAGRAGGGIVALPPGIFSLYKPVTVPEGVLLTGSSCIFMKDTAEFCGGTVILSYVTKGYSVGLERNAGVNGMRFFCPCFDSVTALGHIESGSPESKSCCIKGLAEGVYVTNSVVTAAFTGIDFRGCDRHYIKKVFGVCYLSMIAAGGKEGSIEEVLANMHFSQRHCLNQYFDPAKADPERNWYMLGSHIRDLTLRPHCTTVRIEDASDEQILNLFMYSPCHLIDTKNSSGTYINVSSDFMYGYQLLFERSRVRVVNSLRSCGGSVSSADSDVRITNRIAISNMTELDFDSSKSPVDTYHYKDKIPLCDCESLDGTKLVTLTDDTQYVAEGSHAWLRTGCNKDDNYLVSVRFADTDISSVWPEGRLHISIYVNDYHNIVWGGQIQLCSGGRQHEQMLCWSLPVFLLNKGWNEVYLPFDSAVPAGAPFEPSHANFITMYSYFGENYDNVFAIDNIFACK
ncbi:MAG: hypothetical protein J5758_07150, partial [Abditibacteriota bacterium]|nr:hypothetical protein [Abditibacteriota bacterium]